MKTTRQKPALCVVVLICLAFSASGCGWTPELSRVASELERQLPDAKFDKEFSLSLGPMALGFARFVGGMMGDDELVPVKATGNLDRIMARAMIDAEHERGVPGLGQELGNEFRDG